MRIYAVATTLTIILTTPAFATGNNKSGDTYNDNSVNNTYQTFSPNASASAITKSLNENSLAQSQQSANNVNVSNEGDKSKYYFAPGLGGINLPSGSNGEMAPEGTSFGISALFAGINFGISRQRLSPQGVMHLAELGELASRKWQVTASPDDKAMAEHVINALCSSPNFDSFTSRENLCQ